MKEDFTLSPRKLHIYIYIFGSIIMFAEILYLNIQEKKREAEENCTNTDSRI